MAPRIDAKELLDRTIGKPDGPEQFRPEFGLSVGTFRMRRADLDAPAYRNMPCLMFHVPLQCRGHYKPERMANFDGEREYIVDNHGYRLCEATTKAGKDCTRRAANRQAYCESHGARLHPLDKINMDPQDPAKMTRIELLQHGYIDADDLTDEELMGGVVRYGGNKRMLRFPREVYDKILQRQFARANELLQEGLMPAVECLKTIAANEDEIYEASDRIKAAVFIIEKVMGKAPQVVVNAQAKEPWEQIVAGFMDNSREESRAERGYVEDDERVALEDPSIVDAEVVADEPDPFEAAHNAMGSASRPAPVNGDTMASDAEEEIERLKARIRELTLRQDITTEDRSDPDYVVAEHVREATATPVPRTVTRVRRPDR